MRRVLVLAAVMLAVIVSLPAAPVGANDPFCGIRWGSLLKSDPRMTSAPVVNLRAGRHECFDRLVVDLGPVVPGLPRADTSGYGVQYVPQVLADGSGQPVALRGGAFLNVVVRAPAHDANGNPTYIPPNPTDAINVSGFQTFRQVDFIVTFEGQTQIGLGVRARLPFRVFVLPGPGAGSRVVVDVAHRW
jgi:hypothetical protein